MTDLSVIMLSFNTKDTTKRALEALVDSLSQATITSQVIVLDNASQDGSVSMLKLLKKYVSKKSNLSYSLIANTQNVGFSAGNNQAVKEATGKYILFLNSDAIIKNVDFDELTQYMDKNPDVGVLTVRISLEDGSIDPASHRGFPSVWNSFTYFLGLEKLFGKVPSINKVVGGYHLTHLNLNTIHEIDSPTGAFYLTRKDILEREGGFDDLNFFMYGEDIDLSYRIKKMGYKIMYYPSQQVLHLKYQSGLQKKDPVAQAKTKEYFYDAMKKFYKKHYEEKYPTILNKAIYFFIDLKKKLS